MSDPITDFIRASREICDAATPGPWNAWTKDDVFHDGLYRDLKKHKTGGITYKAKVCSFDDFDEEDEPGQNEDNAAFIAHARTALPAALDIIESQQKQIAEQQAEITRLTDDLKHIAYNISLSVPPGYGDAEGFYRAGLMSAINRAAWAVSPKDKP